MFDQQRIRAAHPLIVVVGEKVLGSFSTLEAAEAFVATKSSCSSLILRHQGQQWVLARDQWVEPLRPDIKSGLCRADRDRAPGRAATLISNLELALQDYPRVTYVASAHCLEVPAQTQSGFRVWIREHGGRYTVGFEKWHREFADPAPAYDCFMLGLSRHCRLRVFRCGGVDCKWQVQRQLERRWFTVSESGLALYPLWWKRQERLLQNDIIPVA